MYSQKLTKENSSYNKKLKKCINKDICKLETKESECIIDFIKKDLNIDYDDEQGDIFIKSLFKSIENMNLYKF